MFKRKSLFTQNGQQKMTKRIVISRLCAAATMLFAAGCMTVGPDYQEPTAIDLSQFEMSIGMGKVSTKNLTTWWTQFNDPSLVSLIERSFKSNNDLGAARATLREVRARMGIAEAARYPVINAYGSAVKSSNGSNSSSISTGNGGHEDDLYTLGFDASWELDIFGSVTHHNEAARADLQSEEEILKHTWVTLASEVAQTYINVRIAQQRLRVTQDNLTAQKDTLDLLKSRFDAGLSDELAVHQARYNLETTRASLPAITGDIESAMNGLAILTGVMPGILHNELIELKDIPSAPLASVDTIPADSIRIRPDIRSAERQLAAQSARVGIATADLYPRFSINGNLTMSGINSTNLMENNSKGFSLGPQVTIPIFNAGTLFREIEAQNARLEYLEAIYRKTVLIAVKEVRDSMMRLNLEQNRFMALQAAVNAAKLAVLVSQDKYKNGLIDFNNVLVAQRSLLSLEEQLVISKGTSSLQMVSLYKALGGGVAPETIIEH